MTYSVGRRPDCIASEAMAFRQADPLIEEHCRHDTKFSGWFAAYFSSRIQVGLEAPFSIYPLMSTTDLSLHYYY
jgi:hypothetical protein